MRREFVGLLAAGCICLSGALVWAKVAAPAPIPTRVGAADIIVVGKVAQLEPKSVTATPTPDTTDKQDYAIAVVEVADGILGAKGVKKVRVGFVPPLPQANPRLEGRFPQLNHQVGQEALYFLKKHHAGDFYITQNYYDVVEKKDGDFDKQLEQTKKAAKLLADPDASLKSKDADERLQTAAMLITRYRTPRAGSQKTEAIDAAQSKLIFETLAGADWTRRGFDQISPLQLFFQLGLTEKDGWKLPQAQQPVEAAQKWCKDNAGKYVIQKFVAEKAK